MRNFCSLWDSAYLPQGLALYDSVRKHSSEPFTLYVLPMDEAASESMIPMHLPGVILVHGFHDTAHMRACRETRTHREYCWTAASNFCEELMATGLDELSYIDADCYFFSDPKVIFDEIGDRSIAVIPHRFIPSKKHLEVNGKYNVSLVHFKNDAIGRECLSTWAAQCREKCSAKDGCGDQKYLEQFEKYGDALCVIQNIGVGLAPWNLANYWVGYGHPTENSAAPVVGLPGYGGWQTVMVHFHEYRHGERLTHYDLRPEDIELIYNPYILAVEAAKERIQSVHA